MALYGRDGRFRGAFGLNQPKLVMPYRRLLANAASWDDALAHAAPTGNLSVKRASSSVVTL